MYAAGILPFKKTKDNRVLLLVGRDKRSKWSDFGGKCEDVDNNCIMETAAREFYEETAGVICDKSTILKELVNCKPLKGKSYTNKDYYMFVVDIDKISKYSYEAPTRFYHMHTFLSRSHQDEKYLEKNKIMWTDVRSLYESQSHLRQVFANTINYKSNKKLIEQLNDCVGL